jgi:hypothetical protein
MMTNNEEFVRKMSFIERRPQRRVAHFSAAAILPAHAADSPGADFFGKLRKRVAQAQALDNFACR